MASKLHHIDINRFKMDIHGEISCVLGMSILCRVESGWGQEGDPVAFYFRGQRLAGPKVYIGDNIYMNHFGSETTWVIAKKPCDPRLSLLWEFGYRSSTRVRVEDPSVSAVCYELRKKAFGFDYTDGCGHTNWAWNEYGAFIGDGFTSPTIIKKPSGKVLVALYKGRMYIGNSGFCQWFLADEATIADVKAALLADCSLNKEHPLLQ